MSAVAALLLFNLQSPFALRADRLHDQEPAQPVRGVGRIWITALEKGSPVTDLKKEDLRLYIGRQEQPISSVTLNPPVPVTIGLLIDVSGSMGDVLRTAEEKIALSFFRTVMKTADQAFVMEVDGKTQVVTGPTSDLAAVQQGLDAVSLQRRFGSTALHDGICQAAEVGGSAPGQARILVLVSDGVDSASHNSLSQALECLQRTHSLLEFVNIGPAKAQRDPDGGLHVPMGDRRHAEMLAEVSRTTGGTSYAVQDANTLSAAFGGVAELLRSRYAVEFEQTGASANGKPKEIRVKCARGGVKILAPETF